jgi:hypothetical protein
MKLVRILVILLTVISMHTQAQDYKSPLAGKWDLTVTAGDRVTASWLEVHVSGSKTLVGHFVADGGSARPVAHVRFDGRKFSFAIPPQWEQGDKDLVFEGVLENDKLSGTMVLPDGRKFNWTGVRAPSLVRAKAPVWGTPVDLFNGKNTSGWHVEAGKKNQWIAENGVLKSPASGVNIISDQKFNDFKLHIEFRYPKHSNSGVYLRGRYEIQVSDSKGLEPSLIEYGALYGFLLPVTMAAKSPGEWQSFDITLVGRLVTVVANGVTIICNQVIPGITGGALDSNEGEPGPIMLQGDHGPIEYRNIRITPAK